MEGEGSKESDSVLEKEEEDAPNKEAHHDSSSYEWASLGSEVSVCLFTYILADIREMIRKRELKGDKELMDKALSLPISSVDTPAFIKLFRDNIDIIKPGDAYGKCFDWAFQDVIEKINAAPEQNQIPTQIVVYDDENQESECVYHISIAASVKRIVVAFRGSVTPMDFFKDAQMFMRDLPVKDYQGLSASKSEVVGIHHGFQDYLFSQKQSSSLVADSENSTPNKRRPVRRQAMQNKCETILNHVAALLEEYPDFRLYVTGHSLGGALATAFSFVAAAHDDPRISKPVTCISIASPKVGNLPFRLATESLEKQRKLRILRVANQGDPITLAPEWSLNCCKRTPLGGNFRHVGMKLLLKARFLGAGYRIYHPCSTGHGACYICCLEVIRKIKHVLFVLVVLPFVFIFSCLTGHANMADSHGLHEYLRRLTQNLGELNKIYLNDLCDEFLGISDANTPATGELNPDDFGELAAPQAVAPTSV